MTMTNEALALIAKDEDLMDEFFIRFSEEVLSDDEPSDKKFRRLYEAWRDDPKAVDDILMTLCGWTMDSLAAKALGKLD